jgi:hypothetical protein
VSGFTASTLRFRDHVIRTSATPFGNPHHAGSDYKIDSSPSVGFYDRLSARHIDGAGVAGDLYVAPVCRRSSAHAAMNSIQHTYQRSELELVDA